MNISNHTTRFYSVLALTITIYLAFAYTGLSAQTKEYRDLIILKDGTVLNGVHTLVTKDSLIVTTSDGAETTYEKKDVSEVMKKAFDASKGYKDLVILKDGTLWSGTQTLVTRDSLIVSWESGETMIYKKSEVSEVKKGVFDKAKGFKDTVTLKDGTVIEQAQTLVNRDSLIVFTEDGTAVIYSKKEVSNVEKGKKEVAVKPTTGSGNFSAYQGYMNWEDAKKKCASIGMRLPTIEELESAYKSGVTETWKTDGYYYWSSTPVGDDRAYVLTIVNGSRYDYYRNSDNIVRCLR